MRVCALMGRSSQNIGVKMFRAHLTSLLHQITSVTGTPLLSNVIIIVLFVHTVCRSVCLNHLSEVVEVIGK